MGSAEVATRPLFSIGTHRLTTPSAQVSVQSSGGPRRRLGRQWLGPSTVPPARKLFQLSQLGVTEAGTPLSSSMLVML